MIPMPIHDQMEAEGHNMKIPLLLDFLEAILETHRIEHRDTDVPIAGQAAKIAFVLGYLGYDYKAWMAEKDALVAHLQSDINEL